MSGHEFTSLVPRGLGLTFGAAISDRLDKQQLDPFYDLLAVISHWILLPASKIAPYRLRAVPGATKPY